jgi:hypothetical protein
VLNTDSDAVLEWTIEKSGGRCAIYFVAEGDSTAYLPNQLEFSDSVLFPVDGTTGKTKELDSSDFSEERWVIGVYNFETVGTAMVSLSVSAEESDE